MEKLNKKDYKILIGASIITITLFLMQVYGGYV